MALDRAGILSVDDLAVREVDVEKWGDTVRLREWSGADRMNAVKLSADLEESEHNALAVVLSAVDDDGELMFTADDIPALLAKNSEVITMLATEVMDLNGLVEKEPGALEKN